MSGNNESLRGGYISGTYHQAARPGFLLRKEYTGHCCEECRQVSPVLVQWTTLEVKPTKVYSPINNGGSKTSTGHARLLGHVCLPFLFDHPQANAETEKDALA